MVVSIYVQHPCSGTEYIALHSFLVSNSRYCAIFPGSHLFVRFSRHLIFVSIFLSSISVVVVLRNITFMYSCFHFLLIFFVSISPMSLNVVIFIYFVDVLLPTFAILPCLFYFSILVHLVYSDVIIQLFYFC